MTSETQTQELETMIHMISKERTLWVSLAESRPLA